MVIYWFDQDARAAAGGRLYNCTCRVTGRRMAGSMRGEVEGWRCGGTRCRLGRLRGARDGSAASSMPRRMHCSRVL